MATAPWYYGWWALPGLTQAHVITLEVLFLVLAYAALAWFALKNPDEPGHDPARRMLESDSDEA